MLKLICVVILLFVTPWNTWAADLQSPTRPPPSGSTGRVLTGMLETAATVSVPAPAPAAAKK